MADVFTIKPSKGFRKNVTPRVKEARFGDGYSQRIVDGINPLDTQWELTWQGRPVAQASEMMDFFEEKGGAEGFLWTPEGETKQYSVICTEWSRSYDSHITATVSATFVRIYDVL